MGKKIHIHTITKTRDVNGNCYHFSVISNLKNDKFFTVKTFSQGNIEHSVCELFGARYAREIAVSTQETLSAKDYRRKEGFYSPSTITMEELKKAFNGIGLRPRGDVDLTSYAG